MLNNSNNPAIDHIIRTYGYLFDKMYELYWVQTTANDAVNEWAKNKYPQLVEDAANSAVNKINITIEQEAIPAIKELKKELDSLGTR